MSDAKILARTAAAAALVNLLALGTASAATLNHRAAATSADASATAARLAVNTGSTSVGPAARNCTRGHLSHGRC